MKNDVGRHMLVCAKRIYEGLPVYPQWIIENLGVSKSTAYRYIARLECELPVVNSVIENANGYKQLSLVCSPRTRG